MDWVKLDTRYYMDPKIVGLPVDAEVLFLRGLAYCGDQETKGFIPEAVVPQLARNRRPATTVKALVDAGLWKRAKGPHGGYLMPAWSTWQDQLDVLAARRQADRDRKRRKRKDALTSNVRGMSADVRVLEGEGELETVKGGMSTHDPPKPAAPPRTCQQHRDLERPPPCGLCADARRAHDAWQAASNGHTPRPAQPAVVHPPDYRPPAGVDIETDGKGIAAAKAALRHRETP